MVFFFVFVVCGLKSGRVTDRNFCSAVLEIFISICVIFYLSTLMDINSRQY